MLSTCDILRIFAGAFLLTWFVSCRGYRTAERNSMPVYFTADSETFTDTIFPVQTVSHSFGLAGWGEYEWVELKKDEAVKTQIRKPTIFRKGYSYEALVYPNEHILISGDSEKDDFYFSSVDGNQQRNRELLLLKTFRKLEKHPNARYAHQLPVYTLQTVLDMEKELETAIPESESISQRIFDSLLNALDASEKFRKLTAAYVKNKYNFNLLWLYRLYKDTLVAHGLYEQKLKAMVPAFNAISKKENFNDNMRTCLNELLIELFPKNMMWSMLDENMFRACFDSIEHNFTGVARNYLLSRTMARAYEKGIKVPSQYKKKYKRFSKDKEYYSYVNDAYAQRKHQDADTATVANHIVSLDGKTTLLFEDVKARYKGKFVLVDCWASWCLPCLREMPYTKQLAEKYSGEEIVFLTLSFDNETVSWHQAIFKEKMQLLNNFLLLDHTKADFTRRNDIQTIPRYLLFDKKGNILNADAPNPSDPALSTLLDSLLAAKPSF